MRCSGFFWERIFLNRVLKGIKLVALDVDGVLTSGGITIHSNGVTSRHFDVKDGLGILMLHENLVHVALISGGKSDSVSERAASLGIANAFYECTDKCKTLKLLQSELGVLPGETLYLGDDLNDLPVLPFVALFCAPSDAHASVLSRADMVLRARGGAGCVRELADRLLTSKGCYGKYLVNGWTKEN